jgi:hypothetical protein
MLDFIMAIMMLFTQPVTQPSLLPVSQVIEVCGSTSQLTLRVDNRIRF